jgi:hypothetical protein
MIRGFLGELLGDYLGVTWWLFLETTYGTFKLVDTLGVSYGVT